MQIELDYPIDSKPRYGHAIPINNKLNEIVSQNTDQYKFNLRNFLGFKEYLLKISVQSQFHLWMNAQVSAAPKLERLILKAKSEGLTAEEQSYVRPFYEAVEYRQELDKHDLQPRWWNGCQPALDALSLYCFVAMYRPRNFIEIGSGYSTMFVRRSINDHKLNTKITSIDPQPRANIDIICDTVIRKSLNECDLSVFGQLAAGDILFLDGTHRVFPSSDVTIFFMEVLPHLPKGVIVQVHDICLPYDYSPDLAAQYYSEQYLLGMLLLGDQQKRYNIIFPANFISYHPELSSIVEPLWSDPKMSGIEKGGSSFWFQIT